jgi:hypothetical protein
MENLFSKFNHLSPDTHRDFLYEKNHLLLFALNLWVCVNILSFIAPNKTTQLAYAFEPREREIK